MTKIAVVTGASAGIGRELAALLAKRGYRVYGLSRRNCAGCEHIVTDISKEEDIERAFGQIGALEGGIDLLINNAGFGISGAVEFSECDDVKSLFDVNFIGAFLCTKYAMPLLRERRGRIVNVSSAAALFAIPFQGFYSASKAALNSMTLALRNEASRFGVSVCAVMPGDTKTSFTDARIKRVQGESVYGGAIALSVSVMERDERGGMEPQRVASAICKIAVKKRVRPLYTIGFKYKVFAVLAKLLPTSAINAVVGKMYIRNGRKTEK